MTFFDIYSLRLILFVIFAGYISSASSQVGRENHYSFGMFKRAITEDSTAPLYILVSVKDNPSANPRRVCVFAPSLLGAIHIEKALPFTQDGRKTAIAIALSNWDKPFVFLQRDAREIVKTRYTSSDANRMRKVIDATPRSDVIARVIGVCAREHGVSHIDACRDAAAHALLERGILVGMADQSGQLFCP